MKKIAIPSRDNKVDNHFGHCENFTIFTITDNKVISKEVLPSPQGCGCKSNIINTLKDKGVTIMLGGNMGQGAFNKVSLAEIQLIRGCSGNLDELISDYLKGNIEDKQIICNHNNDHSCNH